MQHAGLLFLAFIWLARYGFFPLPFLTPRLRRLFTVASAALFRHFAKMIGLHLITAFHKLHLLLSWLCILGTVTEVILARSVTNEPFARLYQIYGADDLGAKKKKKPKSKKKN